MPRKTVPAFLLAAFIATAMSISAFAGDSPMKVTTFNAKAKVTVEQGGGAAPIQLDAEYWVQDEMLRTEIIDPQTKTKSAMIIRDQLVYSWYDGAESGEKYKPESEEGSSAVNFAHIARCLASASKSGTEKVEGTETTKYEMSSCGSGKGALTCWLAKDGSLRKMILKQQGVTSTVVFRGINTGKIPEEQFMPPPRMMMMSRGSTGEKP